MSEQEPYGQQPYGQQPYEPQADQPQAYSAVAAPPPPGYGYPPPQLQSQKTNTMAILGLIFAFVFAPLGIVFSAIGLKQIKRRFEGGRGLALAGLIISILFTIIWVISLVALIAVGTAAVKQAGGIDALASQASAASASAKAPDNGVKQACNVIIPAASDFDQNTGTTAAEIQQQIAQLSTTLQGAAAKTSDPAFIADVQKLVDDFTALSNSMAQHKDPSSLEPVLTADGTKIDADCAAVGVNG